MNKILLGLINWYKKVRTWWLGLSGKSEDDLVLRSYVDGSAWDQFCDQLKVAGAALTYPGAPRDAFQQAEGVRYLSRLTRAALEAFVEYNDTEHPEFRRMVHETVKLGSDNPDNFYLNAQIDGSNTYVIHGQRNTIAYIGFFTQNGHYGDSSGMSPCGVLEGQDIEYAQDGSFEIILSRRQEGQNWLRIEEETGLVIVRQTFADRRNEMPAMMTIKKRDEVQRPEPLQPADLSKGLETAAMFVAGAPMLFAKWTKGFKRHTNQLPLFDPAISNAAGGDANILYYHSYWRLDEDQALVIETAVPDCEMWNFQLNNYWMESLDYRHFRISINQFEATLEEDGTVKVIIAHRDPGHPNWIETTGHTEGTMCWRWYRPIDPKTAPEPQTRVISLNNV